MTETATSRAWGDLETRLRVAMATENHQAAIEIVEGAAATLQRLVREVPAGERPALQREASELLTWAANCARVSRSIWIQDMEQVARLQHYHSAGQLSAPTTTITL